MKRLKTMKNSRLAKATLWITTSLVLAVTSSFAMAQPDRHHHKPNYSHNKHHGQKHRHYRDDKKARPHHAAPRYAPPRHAHASHKPKYRPLPRDIKVIRKEIHPYRHHIKRGPVAHRHVHVVRGKPLPRHYGRVLAYDHYHHHLPYYSGYEWRSSGRDLILVAAATGIVYAVLDNVLN